VGLGHREDISIGYENVTCWLSIDFVFHIFNASFNRFCSNKLNSFLTRNDIKM
jgi:hypothetical protein